MDAGGAGGDSDGGVWALPDDAGKPAGSSGGRLRVDHLHSRSGLAHAQPQASVGFMQENAKGSSSTGGRVCWSEQFGSWTPGGEW